MEELKLQKLGMRPLSGSFSSAYTYATDAERNSYAERVKVYGEVPAMRWLQQLHPAQLNVEGQ